MTSRIQSPVHMRRKIVCAIDTGDLDEAVRTVRRLGPFVGAFKIGHALTLPYGLDVIDRLQDAGAERIFLDLKFHDIPNSVALGVREAARHKVWMTTLHISGGPAMLSAAVEEAHEFSDDVAPLLIGVSVLTSLDNHCLKEHLGIGRGVADQMLALSRLGVECGLDGVVCSVEEVEAVRQAVGHAVIVTPGIRLPNSNVHDQKRTGDAATALQKGSDYLVIGRILTEARDHEQVLHDLGLYGDGAVA